MKTKIFTLCLAMLASIMIGRSASPILIGDLYYNLDNTTKTASVAAKPNGKYGFQSISIPQSVTYNSNIYVVTSIGNGAFKDCTSLLSVDIPYSVTKIDRGAFMGCSWLSSVNMTSSITSIEAYAFENCYFNLISIVIPKNVTSIGDHAFGSCGNLTSVTIPASVTDMSSSAFHESKNINEIYYNGTIEEWCTKSWLTNYVSSSYDLYVQNTKVTNVTIPDCINVIADYLFYGCKSLRSVTFHNNIQTIGMSAFNGCTGIITTKIPDNILDIKNNAFLYVANIEYNGSAPNSPWGARSINGFIDSYFVYSNDSKQNLLACTSAATGKVIIRNSVIDIGPWAFYDCRDITTITIGSNVTNINRDAFNKCTGLSQVKCFAVTPPVTPEYDIFRFVDCSNIPLYVPEESMSTYFQDTQWNKFNPVLPLTEVETFDIRFVNWDGTLLEQLDVDKNNFPEYIGETPTRPDDNEYTYTFAGWTPTIVAATSDATYTALYSSKRKGEDIENTVIDEQKAAKILHNGQIFILRGEKVYTLQGQEVR